MLDPLYLMTLIKCKIITPVHAKKEQLCRYTLARCLLDTRFICVHTLCENIRVYHACEGRIEKYVPRITDWRHRTCRVITIGDHEGQIFLSHPRTNSGFISLLTAKYLKIIGNKKYL